jgi:hypothetical protein
VLLVLLPDIRILDGKEDKAIARGVKERLGELDGHLLLIQVLRPCIICIMCDRCILCRRKLKCWKSFSKAGGAGLGSERGAGTRSLTALRL